jgi:hypothetical protein
VLLAIVFYIHGAFLFPILRAGLSEAAGTSYGKGAPGRGLWAQTLKTLGLCLRANICVGNVGEARQCAVRSDVGHLWAITAGSLAYLRHQSSGVDLRKIYNGNTARELHVSV